MELTPILSRSDLKKKSSARLAPLDTIAQTVNGIEAKHAQLDTIVGLEPQRLMTKICCALQVSSVQLEPSCPQLARKVKLQSQAPQHLETVPIVRQDITVSSESEVYKKMSVLLVTIAPPVITIPLNVPRVHTILIRSRKVKMPVKLVHLEPTVIEEESLNMPITSVLQATTAQIIPIRRKSAQQVRSVLHRVPGMQVPIIKERIILVGTSLTKPVTSAQLASTAPTSAPQSPSSVSPASIVNKASSSQKHANLDSTVSLVLELQLAAHQASTALETPR